MRVLSYAIFIIVLASLISCEQAEEGCLNINAENFNVNAVSSCDSCCVLPQVNFKLFFTIDTNGVEGSFAFNRDYLLENGDTFQINSLQLSFSDFVFKTAGAGVEVEDSIMNLLPRAKDDYIVIENSASIRPIGRLDFVPSVDSIEFELGFDDNFVEAFQPFENIATNSQLFALSQELYVDTTDILYEARFNIELEDSIRLIEIEEIENPRVTFSYDLDLLRGISFTAEFDLNIDSLITGIKATDTNEMIVETIRSNLSNSISRN